MIAVAVPLAIIVLLILANALFVAAEFAIVGAPRTSIESQAAQGSRLAQRVARILDSPQRQDRYIATTQIGISVASLGLGMYGEHVLADWVGVWLEPLDLGRWIASHVVASVVAVAILTYLHIVLGEMVPKALALQRADRTALYVSPVIEVIETVWLPLVVGLNAIGNGILALLGVTRQETTADRYHTTEELLFIVQESHEGGLLRGEAGQILRELFEFGDLSATQVMVPRVRLVGVRAGATDEEVRTIVRSSPHTRYPVYATDMDRIVGSIHIRDLMHHLVAGDPVTSHEARPLPHVPGTMRLDELLATMRRSRAQMAVVMDELGGTAGVVTIEDLFEEVVGEIEEGRGRAPIVRDGPERILVRGTVRLKEAGDALGLVLEHPEVQTISGLVLCLLNRPPLQGDVVTWGSIRVLVVSVRGRGVDEAAVTRAS